MGKEEEYQEVLQALVANLQWRMDLLVRAEADEELRPALEALLPTEIAALWNAYRTGAAEELEGYALFYPSFQHYGTEEQKTRFLLLLSAYPADFVRDFAADCMQKEDFSGAAIALSLLSEKFTEDVNFWADLGIALMHTGDFETAEPCLLRSKALGAGDSTSYALQWVQRSLQ